RAATGTHELDEPIARGAEYWQRAFLRSPAVACYPGKDWPVDMHAVAHAIITLCVLGAELHQPLQHAARLADWSIEHMRDPAGFFYYRRHHQFVNRIPYMRWTQAWMLRALAELAEASADVQDSA